VLAEAVPVRRRLGCCGRANANAYNAADLLAILDLGSAQLPDELPRRVLIRCDAGGYSHSFLAGVVQRGLESMNLPDQGRGASVSGPFPRAAAQTRRAPFNEPAFRKPRQAWRWLPASGWARNDRSSVATPRVGIIAGPATDYDRTAENTDVTNRLFTRVNREHDVFSHNRSS
jgi:hypothetical protein